MASPRIMTTTRAKGRTNQTLDVEREEKKEIRRFAINVAHLDIVLRLQRTAGTLRGRLRLDMLQITSTTTGNDNKVSQFNSLRNSSNSLHSKLRSTELRALLVVMVMMMMMMMMMMMILHVCFRCMRFQL